MRQYRWAWLVLLGMQGALCTGCDRERMADTYGRSSREFFARQHVYAQSTQGSPQGLDSEESALIQSRYRQSLGDESRQDGEASSKVLLLPESQHGAR